MPILAILYTKGGVLAILIMKQRRAHKAQKGLVLDTKRVDSSINGVHRNP